jgi:hypothetical protein
MATTSKQPRVVGYNVQSAVETTHHLIIAHEVTNLGYDRDALAMMAHKARDAMAADRDPSRRWCRARWRPELRRVAQQRRASTRGSVFGAGRRVRRWPIHNDLQSFQSLEPAGFLERDLSSLSPVRREAMWVPRRSTARTSRCILRRPGAKGGPSLTPRRLIADRAKTTSGAPARSCSRVTGGPHPPRSAGRWGEAFGPEDR